MLCHAGSRRLCCAYPTSNPKPHAALVCVRQVIRTEDGEEVYPDYPPHRRAVEIEVELGRGDAEATVLGTDLTHECKIMALALLTRALFAVSLTS